MSKNHIKPDAKSNELRKKHNLEPQWKNVEYHVAMARRNTSYKAMKDEEAFQNAWEWYCDMIKDNAIKRNSHSRTMYKSKRLDNTRE